MRVALVKQNLDIVGPWASMRWSETSPSSLFDIWPNKCWQWGMTCLLRADWYVTPLLRETWYIQNAVLEHTGRAAIIEKHSHNLVQPQEIPYDQYDVVISFDPILKPPRGSTVFAYFMQEHWDPLYRKSLRKPEPGYDLFLDHLLQSPTALRQLPQSVSFPYLCDLDTMRHVFQTDKEDVVWVDARTLCFLARTRVWTDAARAAAQRLQEAIGVPVRFKGEILTTPWGISDPPTWGDSARYFEAVGGCRYYISVGRGSGGGVGVADAASLGCICFGDDRPYHKLICHPACLIQDLAELPQRVRHVASSPDLQEEIICWQDRALRQHFAESPLRLLEQAVSLKRGTTFR